MSKLILAFVFSFSTAGATSTQPVDDQLQIERALARHFQPDARLVDPTAHLELAPETLHARSARAALSAVESF